MTLNRFHNVRIRDPRGCTTGSKSFAGIPTATASGQNLQYLQTGKPEVDSVVIAPGGETGPHMYPVPAYVYVVEGTVTVDMDHGSPRE